MFRKNSAVDILIRGWDNLPLLRRLLRSIEVNTTLEHQVIYVDNGSRRQALADLMLDFPDVTVVALPFNHGSVRAINIGLSLALMSSAQYVVLMDNDTEVPAGDKMWLQRFIAPFDDHDVAAVGAVTNYVSGYQHCEAVPDLYQREWHDGDQQGIAIMPDFPILVSFAMALRKEAVKKCGLFDERYEPGNVEDYDYVLRLHQAGYQAVIAPSVWIHHKGSQTFKQFDFPALLSANYQKLVDKFGVAELQRWGVMAEAV